MNNQEIERLRIWTMDQLKEDFDKFDYEHEIDRSLTIEENKNIISDKIELMKEKEINKASAIDEMMKIEQDKAIGRKLGLKEIFGQARIIGLAGNRNSGKTNNLLYLLQEFRKGNEKTQIYVYGFPETLTNSLKKHKINIISSMRQLTTKKSCLIIIEEFQRLKLSDRRYKEIKDDFVDFIYHSNNYCILSSPNIREFNSVIGGNIEKWLLKSVDISQCINGSQLKQVVDEYKGAYKKLGSIVLSKEKLLLINNDEEIIIKCDYVKWADTKLQNQRIL